MKNSPGMPTKRPMAMLAAISVATVLVVLVVLFALGLVPGPVVWELWR